MVYLIDINGAIFGFNFEKKLYKLQTQVDFKITQCSDGIVEINVSR